jgi:hypothetical protein
MRYVLGIAIGAAALLLIGEAKAEQFKAGDKYWNKEGAYWVEYPPYASNQHFTFQEQDRVGGFVVLYDPTRHFELRLPLAGGLSSWRTPDKNEWISFETVTHLN